MEALKDMQQKVKDANTFYEDVRKEVRIPNEKKYQRDGIKSLSEPFIQGVFTLAVIGPMSAGKSSFINALLEDEDLLPTGHFQTTCTLTELVYSQEKRLRVEYGDGHIDYYEGESILKTIKDVAAIPEKFNKIPINHINQLILQGLTLDEIWKYKDGLEKIAGGIKISRELLEMYYNSKNASNIPVHVWVEYPLSDSYKGWRIVDTPGIGAIGGIDEKTKEFIANENVDAAIFLFNGKNEIDKNEINEAVSLSYNQLSDVAKNRTFFVITHGGDPDCQSFIESTLSKAVDLFSEGAVQIPRERFFVVDSMLSILYDCSIKTHNFDPSVFLTNIKENYKILNIEQPKEDDSDEDKKEKAEKIAIVKEFRKMFSAIQDIMVENSIEVNTENINKQIIQTAGFVSLKKELGDFAKNAKQEAYDKIRDKIIDDFEAFGSKKREDKTLLGLKITKSPEDFAAEIKKKIEESNAFKTALTLKYNEIIVAYNSQNLPKGFKETKEKNETKIDNAKYYYEIENACNNFNDLIKQDQELTINKFIRECERLTRKDVNNQFTGMVLPVIDVDAAKNRAEIKATHTVSYQVDVKKKGVLNALRRLFGSEEGWETETRYKDEVNESEQLNETKADVKAQMTKTIIGLSTHIFNSYIKPTGEDIQKQLQELIKEKNKEYQNLQQKLMSENDVRSEMSTIDNELKILEKSMIDLDKIMTLK